MPLVPLLSLLLFGAVAAIATTAAAVEVEENEHSDARREPRERRDGDGEDRAGPRQHRERSEQGKEKKKASWFEGLDNVKVLHPGDPDLQKTVDDIWKGQESWQGHFNDKRYAILLTPGQYPQDFVIPVSYYTSVLGVGAGPDQVQLDAVRSLNGPNGHATNNFWRSVEGVTLRAKQVDWAVSQGAPIRRSVVHGHLYLSDHKGFSSGGFISDVVMGGTLMAGMQQQWLFRNMDMPGGIYCPAGWNYVFVGVKDIADKTYQDCEGLTAGKVTVIGSTPRVAEKPYLVQEDDGKTWRIYVPVFMGEGSSGATKDHAAAAERKLELGDEVFVAEPGQSAEEINKGIAGKKGLLLTPGIYELERPIVIETDGFVVLGLGFATLVPTDGRAALEVASGLEDVRVAGILLEAGTPKDKYVLTEPLLRWGNHSKARSLKASDAQQKGEPSPRSKGPSGVPGVLSDVFARVGSFKYRGCPVVRADTMIEINSDDVVLDNTWLWHADHDDCGTDPGNSLDKHGKSDECFTKHGLVVNGDHVTAYGTAVEHITHGDMVSWRGDQGEAYFYQSELPYHNDGFSTSGFVAYSVEPAVKSHLAAGMGVYIISGKAKNKGGYMLPPGAKIQNLMTVVVIGETWQFPSTLCTRGSDGDEQCYGPTQCAPHSRCIVRSMPAASAAPAALFLRPRAGGAWVPAQEEEEEGPPATAAASGARGGGSDNSRLPVLLAAVAAPFALALAATKLTAISSWRQRVGPQTRTGCLISVEEPDSPSQGTE